MDKKKNFTEISESNKIWAIGSIHSRYNAFKSIKKYLLEKFEENDSLVFLGNIIGLGIESKKTLNYCSHLVDEADIKTVTRVLKSQALTNGKEVEKFEKNFAKVVKSKFAVTCSNGTTALHLALLSLKIKKGDYIIVPNITFVASFNSILMAGGTPIICDVDEHTGLINIHKINQDFVIVKFQNF